MLLGSIGAGSTGKTSLMMQLAKELELTYYPSVNRAVFAKYGQTQLTHAALPVAERWKIQWTSFVAKILQDKEHPTGVFERTLLDHFMYCMLYCAEVIDQEHYNLMVNAVFGALDRYDVIFYFPIYAWGNTEQDGWRDATWGNRNLQQLIINGFILANPQNSFHHRIVNVPDCSIGKRIIWAKTTLQLRGIK